VWRYTTVADPADIEQRFGVSVPFSEGTRRYNIAPTESVVAIVLGRDGAPSRASFAGPDPQLAKDAKSRAG